MRLLEWANDLFGYLKDLHHVTRDADKGDSEERFTLRFFAHLSQAEESETLQRIFDEESADTATESAAQSTLGTGDYVQISNPDFKAFVPRFEVDDIPKPPTIAARLSLKGNTIQVEAAKNDEPSAEHPLLLNFKSEQGSTAKLSLLYKLNFTTEYQPIDYGLLKKLTDINEATHADEVDYIRFNIPNAGAFKEPFDPNEWSFKISDMGLDRDLIGFIARLELITQQRIPVPSSIPEEQLEILEDNYETVETREDAQSVIDQLKSSGEGHSAVHFFVEYEDEEHHLTTQQGSPTLTFTTDNGQTVVAEDLPGGGRDISINYDGIPGTAAWFVEYIKENPEEAKDIMEKSVPGNGDSDEEFFLTLDIDLHIQTFCYDESKIVIRPGDQPPDEVNSIGG